jgi:hypothetical protein
LRRLHLDVIYGPPKVVLFAIYLYEDFIDVEGIAVAAMLTLQSSGVQGAELDAPKANCFSADGDTPLSQ